MNRAFSELIKVGLIQEKCNKDLVIQIEWRQIWYLCFTYQSQIVSEDA